MAVGWPVSYLPSDLTRMVEVQFVFLVGYQGKLSGRWSLGVLVDRLIGLGGRIIAVSLGLGGVEACGSPEAFLVLLFSTYVCRGQSIDDGANS